MDMPNFEANRPRTPQEEGLIVGLTMEEEYREVPVDGEDHPTPDITTLGIDIQGIDDALIDRDDFLEGVGKGMALRRELAGRGFKVLQQESDEAVLEAHLVSHGGSI